MITNWALKLAWMFHKMILEIVFWGCPVITMRALYASNLLLKNPITPSPCLQVSSQFEIRRKGFSTGLTLMSIVLIVPQTAGHRTEIYSPSRIEAEAFRFPLLQISSGIWAEGRAMSHSLVLTVAERGGGVLQRQQGLAPVAVLQGLDLEREVVNVHLDCLQSLGWHNSCSQTSNGFPSK